MDNAVSNEIALYSDAVESNTGQVDPYNTTTQSNKHSGDCDAIGGGGSSGRHTRSSWLEHIDQLCQYRYFPFRTRFCTVLAWL
jgi:hypothetical protein